MTKRLSPEEIKALLQSAQEIEQGLQGRSSDPSQTTLPYDFRRPDRISKEQIRSLQFLHDRFARNVSTSLSAYLRVVTEVAIVSVEQFTYGEFLMTVPELTAFYAVSINSVDALGALELNPIVAFTMIDRMLGGTGDAVTANRALTEIEQNVIDGVVKVMIDNLAEAWQSIVEVQFKIAGRETRPQLLAVAAPNETMILLVFDVRIAQARGMLNLCLPVSWIEAVGASFVQSRQQAKREPTPLDRQRLYANLARVPLAVTALLETQMPVRDLLALRPGDIISLGRDINDPVELHVGATPKFTGRIVRTERGAGVAIDGCLSSFADGGPA